MTRTKRIQWCKDLQKNEKAPDLIRSLAFNYRSDLMIYNRTRRVQTLTLDMQRFDSALANARTRYDVMIRSEKEHLKQLKMMGGAKAVLDRVSGPRNHWDSTFIPRLMQCDKQIKEYETTVMQHEVTISNVKTGISDIEVAKTRKNVANMNDDTELEDYFKDIGEDFELTPVSALLAAPGPHQQAFSGTVTQANAAAQVAINSSLPQGSEMDAFKSKLLRDMGVMDDAPAAAGPAPNERIAIPTAAGMSRSQGASLVTEFD
jgi:hypothetical protein